MKTQRKVDALIKHLGLEFIDEHPHDVGDYRKATVTCPDENGITNRVDSIEEDVSALFQDMKENLVECKTCHCLLKKESAIKGEKRVEEGICYEFGRYSYAGNRPDTIVQDYFCGRCAPKRGRK